MDRRFHFRVLGALFIVWGAWGIAVVLILAFAPGLLGARAWPTPPGAPPVAIVGSVADALLFIAAGWALLARKLWSRLFGIVMSVLALLNFPLGTALGIYGLWATLAAGARRRSTATHQAPPGQAAPG